MWAANARTCYSTVGYGTDSCVHGVHGCVCVCVTCACVRASPAPVLLNQSKHPIPPQQWDELDAFIQENITPAVLHAGYVNVLHHAITHSLYTYLVSRFVAMPVKMAANAVEVSTCQLLK